MIRKDQYADSSTGRRLNIAKRSREMAGNIMLMRLERYR